MRLNRRNVLVGLGTIVAGGGAALGTGAFSSVEADRSVSVTTAGDSGGLLRLDLDDSYTGITDDGGDGTQGENIIGISLDEINDDAVTTFDEALTITNGGSNPVTISIENNDVEGVTFTINGDGDLTASGEGDDETTVDIEVDTNGTVSDGDITIEATDNS